MNEVSEVIPGLFLGNLNSLRRTITTDANYAVLSIIKKNSEIDEIVRQHKIDHCEIDIEDAPDVNIQRYFEEACTFIESAMKNNVRVLVHCKVGISRSSTIILAYLVKNKQMSLLEAYNLLKEKRSVIRPNNGFWKQLVEYEKDCLGQNSVTFIQYQGKEIPSIYEQESRNMIYV